MSWVRCSDGRLLNLKRGLYIGIKADRGAVGGHAVVVHFDGAYAENVDIVSGTLDYCKRRMDILGTRLDAPRMMTDETLAAEAEADAMTMGGRSGLPTQTPPHDVERSDMPWCIPCASYHASRTSGCRPRYACPECLTYHNGGHPRAVLKALDHYQKLVEEIADEQCLYGDQCPSNHGTRHGTCTPCKARAALAYVKSNPEGWS